MNERLAELMDTVDGDEDLLRELIGVFLEDAPRLLGQVHRALMTGDGTGLYRSAHTLKGSAGNFAAPQVVACIARIEAGARANDFAAAWRDFGVLEATLQTLFADLSAFEAGSCGC